MLTQTHHDHTDDVIDDVLPKRAGRILRLAGGIAHLAAIALLGVAFVLVVGLGVGPRTGLYRTATVLTNSMAPGMPAGSMAVVRPLPTSKLAVGDVITYQSPVAGHPIVTHRVVAVSGDHQHPVVITKGDANRVADPWTTTIAGPTVWRRVLVIPHLGRLVHDVRALTGAAPVTTIVPFVVYGLFLVRLWRPRLTRRPVPT